MPNVSLDHIRSSLNVVEHLDGSHESADADAIIGGVANFLRLIVNGVEFADFVAVTDCLEQGLDGVTVTRHLEVSFLDSDLGVRRREEQVDGLRLVSVVLVVGNRLLSFEWNVDADGWAAE